MGWQPQQPSMPQQKTDAIFDSVRLVCKRSKTYFLFSIHNLAFTNASIHGVTSSLRSG